MRLITFVLFVLPHLCFSQTFEFVSWNALNYSVNTGPQRTPEFKLVFSDMHPEILALQEVTSEAAAILFRDQVLNADSTTYTMAPFIDASSLNNALYFKTQKFSVGPTKIYPTALRPIYRFSLLPNGMTDTLYVFSVHLKAGSSSSDRAQRDAELDTLRKYTNALPAGSYFLACGDFNLKSETDGSGYQMITTPSPNNDGALYEFISWTGSWSLPSNAILHTQSPRSTASNSTIPYGTIGGAGGGMDDRFDLVLGSRAIYEPGGIDYIPGSYEAYGNAGLHYNVSLLDPPAHPTLPANIISAIHNLSDHLPVRSKFSYSTEPMLSAFASAEISARTISQNENIILRYARAQAFQAPLLVNEVKVFLESTLNTGDIAELQLLITSDSVATASAVPLQSITNPAVNTEITFSGLQYPLPLNQARYFYVRAVLQPSADPNGTLSVGPIQFSSSQAP